MSVHVITQLLKGLLPPAVNLVMTAVGGPTFMLTDPSNYLVHLTPSLQTQHYHTAVSELGVTAAVMTVLREI